MDTGKHELTVQFTVWNDSPRQDARELVKRGSVASLSLTYAPDVRIRQRKHPITSAHQDIINQLFDEVNELIRTRLEEGNASNPPSCEEGCNPVV